MYQHIWAEIDLDALSHNIKEIKTLVPANKIMGVVKANAYGHGAGAVASLLQEHGINHFAVSNVYEAIDLRTHGITGNILLLGYVDPTAIAELIKQDITVCVYDTNSAHRLSEAAKQVNGSIKCHIKIDSGMCRLGFNCRNTSSLSDFEKELTLLFGLSNLQILGAFTHFAASDRDHDTDGTFTEAQYSRAKAAFSKMQQLAKQLNKTSLCFHSANSAATLLDHQSKPSDLYRAGIVLYGLTPSTEMELPISLKPVLTLKATVAQVKTISAGDTVSYGRTFTAKHDMKVATVTAGYADGYMRGLSGKGYMLINGGKAPILGRVCMDQTVVDVTNIPDVSAGDTAVLFGVGLPAEELANLLGTINYELVCAVAHRVPRVYLKNGEIVDTVRYCSI